jgi:hypothetical protein
VGARVGSLHPKQGKRLGLNVNDVASRQPLLSPPFQHWELPKNQALLRWRHCLGVQPRTRLILQVSRLPAIMAQRVLNALK